MKHSRRLAHVRPRSPAERFPVAGLASETLAAALMRRRSFLYKPDFMLDF